MGRKKKKLVLIVLNSEALREPLPKLKSGDLNFKVFDERTGSEKMLTVHLESKDTLEMIAEKINMIGDVYLKDQQGNVIVDKDGNKIMKENPTLRAMVNKDGSFKLDTGPTKKFIYQEDETDFLALMGFNSFFHIVAGAEDMRLNPELKENELSIAAGYDLVPGDNRIALEIAELQYRPTMFGGEITFDEFYNSQVADVGLRLQRAEKEFDNHTQILAQFEALRDSVSSVNMDEEVANMAMYQKSYEASARFISTIDEMTETLLNM